MLAELGDALAASRAEPFRRAAHSPKSTPAFRRADARGDGARPGAAGHRARDGDGSPRWRHYEAVAAELKALRDA
jgi:hypothetical protein